MAAMSERDLPVSLIRAYGFRRGAELGVWRGARAWKILEETGLDELVLVDPWREELNRFDVPMGWVLPARMGATTYHCTMGEPHQDQAALEEMAKAVEERAARYGGRARVLRMASFEASALILDGSLDFVIWDAIHLHGTCRDDLMAWKAKLRSGGLLCGDGYGDAGVRAAVDTELGPEKWVQGDFWGTIIR